MSRREDVDRLYELLDRLASHLGEHRFLSSCNGKMGWPRRGVYFFFEHGELREDRVALRVVRVGTHAIFKGSHSTLWGRLRSHRGSLKTGAGNHRGSVFRLLVGSAILQKRGQTKDFPAWGKERSAKAWIRDKERRIEIDVSNHIRNMPFIWLAVEDEPGPSSHRAIIEKGAIALLSNKDGREVIDPPTENWLGKCCPYPDICESGLWNSRHTDEHYDMNFLKILEGYVAKASRPKHVPSP